MARLHGQAPIEWDALCPNRGYAISHRHFWQMLSDEIGINRHLLDTDACALLAPGHNFKVWTECFQGDRSYGNHLQYNVYTDGSKTGTNVGSGFLVLEQDLQIDQDSIRLSRHSTVFQAEIYAVLAATQHMKRMWTNNKEIKQIKFFVDSQATLWALCSNNITSMLVYRTVTALNELATECEVSFVWTKAHVGTAGNERADRLAKAGAELQEIQHIDAPRSSLKAEIDTRIREKWDVEWQRYKHGRQTKFFYPTQDKKKAKQVMGFNRIELGRYIRIVTGHSNLLYHRNNVDPVNNDSICRFCIEDVETFIHFATDCPARWRERRDNLLVYVGDQLMSLQPQQLLDLAYTDEIKQLLEMRYDDNDSSDPDEPEDMEQDANLSTDSSAEEMEDAVEGTSS